MCHFGVLWIVILPSTLWIQLVNSGALALIAGGFATLKGAKELFYSSKSSRYDVDHPFSCTEYCGLAMLDAKYTSAAFPKAASQIAPYLKRQFAGTVFGNMSTPNCWLILLLLGRIYLDGLRLLPFTKGEKVNLAHFMWAGKE